MMWRNRSSSLLYSVSFASGKIKILCGKITIATPPLEITSTLQNTEGSIKKHRLSMAQIKLTVNPMKFWFKNGKLLFQTEVC